MRERKVSLLRRTNDQSLLPQAWVFVRVIDNFGDVGVAWRLAQNLAAAFQATVHLWVDEVEALNRLAPQNLNDIDSTVVVHTWADDDAITSALVDLPPPQWVIETFGCDLPAPVVQRMPRDQPLWLNWEYLSAEDWAREVHGLPSLQGNGVAKYFWLMGFEEASGGLLREQDYQFQRQQFLHDSAAQNAFCQQYGLPVTHQGQLWLVFAYASPLWLSWLAMWQCANEPITLWLAGGQVVDGLRQAGLLPESALRIDGDSWQMGCVRLVRIPFVPQSAFDRLLWLMDGAVVRGEDSFVRAQLAGLPFFWHIYTQAEKAHLVKLRAFWQLAMQRWPASLQTAFLALSDELNGASTLTAPQRLAAWQALQQGWTQWQALAQQWAGHLQAQPSAMEKLARFRQDTLK
ncbi:elongation factor P maturation arginine rhamnosyltransferase EarP [Snodgrassella sp. CFCC 13594]|uniref:elongation factor P maturation arginine rhamnosyltransferase EarP n=1 Tax=Snodgrassella sp. CFCC 13594 TaxID=1775559 RepID=UPI0009EDE25F|nr:elongation factor P maturation arginine rhamnosyltransferase EarP [Snodgrassella sp. CFCC 13594]